jgi:hypothetical protein
MQLLRLLESRAKDLLEIVDAVPSDDNRADQLTIRVIGVDVWSDRDGSVVVSILEELAKGNVVTVG